MTASGFEVEVGEGPFLATAIHAGHDLRAEVADLIVLDEQSRFREEDPHTDRFTTVVASRIVPYRSRFEVDLNRARDEAVYRKPEDAWGLGLWKEEPSEDLVRGSLAYYDRFYELVDEATARLERRYGRFVVLDCHSYNHRRHGPEAPPEDPDANPDVNVGTGTLNRALFGSLVDRFISELATFDLDGHRLDVRENVKFRGRQLAQHVHERHPGTGAVLAIEFKKTFMDEWSGQLDSGALDLLSEALRSTLPGLEEELERLG